MTPLQKGTVWILGCLLFVFALSIGLSWIGFGYLDLETVWKMGLMMLPILGAAAVVLLWTGREEEPPRVWNGGPGNSWRKGK